MYPWIERIQDLNTATQQMFMVHVDFNVLYTVTFFFYEKPLGQPYVLPFRYANIQRSKENCYYHARKTKELTD